jgi:hypothetical protein
VEIKAMTDKVALRIDPDALTIGDLEDFEDVTGSSLFDAIKPVQVKDEDGNLVRDEKGRPETEVKLSAKALKALIWIMKRAEEPNFTVDDARNVRVSSLEIVDNGESEPEGNGESGETD